MALLCDDTSTGLIKVANTRHYTPLIGDARYVIKVGRKSVASGTIPVRVMPKSDAVIQIPLNKVPRGKLFDIELEIVRPAPVDKYEVDADRSHDGSVRLARKVFRGVL